MKNDSGAPVTPHRDSRLPLPSRTIGIRQAELADELARVAGEVLVVDAEHDEPPAVVRRAASCRSGASSRHGPHHEAQKLTTRGLPSYAARLSLPSPSSRGSEKSGAAGVFPFVTCAATLLDPV